MTLLCEVSWEKLSQDYFSKSSSWIYNKLQGREDNEGERGFTEPKKIQLQGALYDS
ncbi:DUF5053 domain-containing protein [Capnocytophaga sp. oral taxon 338]|uniref:DUF5053 domain-containing protein n=1 Tax=Capnocytophaga sp. oral taxon 338 TaxID=710239 RepID=UPI000202ECFD|nr:hypothetical protein HMPREF9071_0582 [Capnocytophaga sp. oral taxon 338 str. F0234]